MHKLIAFDLDSVILDGESIDHIAKYLGKDIQKAEASMNGKKDFKKDFKNRIEKLIGFEVKRSNEIIRKMKYNKGMPKLIRKLKNQNIVGVISGNMDFIVECIAKDLDLDFFISSKAKIENGRLIGLKEIVSDKSVHLRKLSKKFHIPLHNCIAIGDGANDIEMLKVAGLGIGFNPKPIVRKHADIVIEKHDSKKLLEICNSYPNGGELHD